MAIALVANTTASGTNGATTSGINTTGANFLRLAVCSLNQPTSATLNDSNGNTWTQFGSVMGGSGAYISYFYVTSPTVGSGHTFTFTNATIFAVVDVIALSGVATSSPVETTFTQNYANPGVSSSTGSIAPGSLTPTSNNAYLDLIGAQVDAASGVACSDGLYTLVQDILGDNTTTITGTSFYEVQTTATASNPSVQFINKTATMSAVLIAIDAGASGGGPDLMGQIIL